jgi:hypothetical protein
MTVWHMMLTIIDVLSLPSCNLFMDILDLRFHPVGVVFMGLSYSYIKSVLGVMVSALLTMKVICFVGSTKNINYCY